MARNSWGSVRTLKSGRVQAHYTAPDGNRYKADSTFPDQLAAYAWLASVRKQIDLGTWEPPAQARESEVPSVGGMVEHWFAQTKVDLRDSSVATYTDILNHRIFNHPELTSVPVDKLTPLAVARWWKKINDENPATVDRNKRAYSKLRAAIGLAVEYGIIPYNPVEIRAARKRPVRKRKTLPETEDLKEILEHMPERYKLATALCLFHGLRIGETLGLQHRHVETTPAGYALRIEGTLQRLVNNQQRTCTRWQPKPKTDAGFRQVPVLAEFNSVIENHLNQFPGTGEEFLTTTATGKPVMDTSFRSVFNNAKKRAGAPAEITPHYGRNWLITRLAEAGATPKEIGRILGQEDVSTILDVYMRVREHRPSELMSRVNLAG